MFVEKAGEAIEKMRFETPVKATIEIIFESYVWFRRMITLVLKVLSERFFDILKYF